MLKSCGFSGLDVEVQDCQSPEHYMISTITSTAVEPINGSLPPTVIVTTDASPSGQWLGSLREAVFSLIGKLPDIEHINVVNGTDKICIFLDLPSGIMRNAAQKQFDSIRSLLTTARGVLWVSHGGAMEGADPDAAIHIGFLRTMRNETGGRRYVSLDLDATRQTWHSDCIQTICNVFRSTFIGSFENGTKDFEYTEQHGSIYTPRLFDDTTLNTALDENASQPEMALEPFHQPEKPVRMAIGIPGSLDSLYFHDDPNATKLIAGDEIEIDPKAFGINFRDVMVAMGRLEQNAFMGFECAGTIVRLGKEAAAQGFKVGERICTVLQGHWATLPRASWKYVARIPDDMAYEVAASIPLVYCTAYVSLYEVANLQKGEKILIHAATGGVGQAAITFAQNIGAEIFVTAGTAGKRELVKENFGIPDDHIFSSRDVSFAEGVLKSTQGKGVDVVLNSLSGKLLQESFNCLGDFGRFVEIGKRDLEQNSSLDMFPFTRNVSFAAVDLNMWAEHKPERISRILNATLDLLRTNAIRTISPITTYPISDIEKAFRTMQTGNHLGKLVVSVGATDLVPVSIRHVYPSLAVSAFTCTNSLIDKKSTAGCDSSSRCLVSDCGRNDRSGTVHMPVDDRSWCKKPDHPVTQRQKRLLC